MSKKIVLSVLSLLLVLQNKAFSANEDQLTQLDAQRNEELNEITSRLIQGKISPSIARQLKVELDDVTKLESNARGDNKVTTTEVYNISKCLEKVRSHITAQTNKTKVWLGIDSHDKTLHNKIADALAIGQITKEQADTLEQEYEKLRSREGNGYPVNSLGFNDAIAIAEDEQTLNNKIDELIAGTNSIH